MEATNKFGDINVPIAAILSKYLSHWYYFAISLALCLGIASFKYKTTPPSYEIKSVLLLDDNSSNNDNKEEFMKEMGLFAPKAKIEDEIGFLTSYPLIEETLSKMDVGVGYYEEKLLTTLRLYDHVPFEVYVDSTHRQIVNVPFYVKSMEDGGFHIRAQATNVEIYDIASNKFVDILSSIEIDQVLGPNEILENENLRIIIKPQGGVEQQADQDLYFEMYALPDLAIEYKEFIEIEKVGEESNLISITSTGESIDLQEEFINKLMQVYIDFEIDKKNRLGSRTLSFIDKQIYSITDSLRNAESSLEEFRTKSNIVDIGKTSESLAEQLIEMETEEGELKVKSDYYKYLLETLRSNVNRDLMVPSTIEIQDPVLDNLLLELSNLNRENVSLSISAKPTNPRRIQLRKK